MSILGSIFPGDKELGKKDDDHRPGRSGSTLPGSWHARRQVSGARRRKIIYAVLGVFALFLFVKNIPTDLGPNNLKGDVRVPTRGGSLAPSTQQDAPEGRPPQGPDSSGEDDHYFSGPVKFYKLAATLHGVATLAGRYGNNKNVLFAAASLKSASEIMPMACEMAALKRNDVHFAFMGREELEIHEIKEINGINDDDCSVHWHDGRPDYSRWSTDFRMEISVSAGLGHISKFVFPQAILIDSADREESFFVNSIKSKAAELGTSLIELPASAAENMMWIARLDSSSLAAWQTTYIDLLIHAPPNSSGSLIRLLKSIEQADYFSYRRPHLTIELPADIDPSSYTYLENFIWPPLGSTGASHASQVTLRHRIPKRTFTTTEVSSYFVESFYPARPADSHVLVLSPQVELSPVYYHYLMYNLLELRYSRNSDVEYVMGVSLELPSTYLNGSTLFEPPATKSKPKDPVPFLWGVPNCNAALYFGERWMEFHSFLANRISTMRTTSTNDPKLVSESYPAWMEFLLELMRARGYAMFYPHYEATKSNAFATVHTELYQPPEEFSNKIEKGHKDEDPPTLEPTDVLETSDTPNSQAKPYHPEYPLLKSSLVSLLPPFGDVPPLSTLPHISYDGAQLTAQSRVNQAEDYASTFRLKIGGCTSKNGKAVSESELVERSANDLFCNLDNPPEELPDRRNTGPLSRAGQAQTSFEKDPDVVNPVPADSGADVKSEFAEHLRRQSGEKKLAEEVAEGALAAFGDDSTNSVYDWDPIIQEDKEAIIPERQRNAATAEFEKQLARQRNHQQQQKEDGSSKPRTKEVEPKTSDDKNKEVLSSAGNEKTTEESRTQKESVGKDKSRKSSGIGGIEDAETQERNPGW